MTHLHFPWLEFAVLLPLVAAMVAARMRHAERARQWTLAAMGATLVLASGAPCELYWRSLPEAMGRFSPDSAGLGLVVDGLSAPLLPLVALLHFLLVLSTLRAKIKRVPFAWTLVSLAIQLALFSCCSTGLMILLLAVQTVPPWLEVASRGRRTRIFVIHMVLSLALLATGWGILEFGGANLRTLGVGALVGGLLVRSGVVPFHCWVTDLFEKATLGTTLLFVVPMPAAYVAIRLLLPIAPEWAWHVMGIWALVTALYAAAMATVERDARRFLCTLFLSNASLVLVGLQSLEPVGLTGSLCVWLSVALTLLGQGLTLRAIESRVGHRSLAESHGLYRHMPMLASFFLLTGLSSIGFPGTIGFVATELLVEGALRVSPVAAILVVATMALNGVALLRAYFRLFTGPEHTSSMSLRARWPEQMAVLTFTLLVLGGGLVPQPGVASRYDVARDLLSSREEIAPEGRPKLATLPLPNSFPPTD